MPELTNSLPMPQLPGIEGTADKIKNKKFGEDQVKIKTVGHMMGFYMLHNLDDAKFLEGLGDFEKWTDK